MSTIITGKLIAQHPYKSYLFSSPNPRFGCLQCRKGINSLLKPISLLGLCSNINLFPNISYCRFYICTACFTQTSQLAHWLVPELEMRTTNQSAARRIYINNFTSYFAPQQKINTHRAHQVVWWCGSCYRFTVFVFLLWLFNIHNAQKTKQNNESCPPYFMISTSLIIMAKLIGYSQQKHIKTARWTEIL